MQTNDAPRGSQPSWMPHRDRLDLRHLLRVNGPVALTCAAFEEKVLG